jgi:Flp pilus assembly protein TadD
MSTWSHANRIAVTHLHLGDPDSARRVWAAANDPPSQALRLTRMASADLAALDSTAAVASCRAALKLDSTLGEAWYVLAIALVESGRADLALAAVRESLKHPLTDSERKVLAGVEALLNRSRP